MSKWIDELDKLTKEELLAEAEKIEKELGLPHEIDDEVDEIFYLYEEMKKVNRLKEEAEKKKRRRVQRWKRTGKVLFRAGLAMACIFAASMTSEANREKVVWGIKYSVGKMEGEVKYSVDDGKIDKKLLEEKSSYEKMKKEMKDQLGVEVPEFMYLPDDFKLERYQIYQDSYVGKVSYKFQNQCFLLYMRKESDSMIFSAGLDSLIIDEEIINNGGIEIKLLSCVDQEKNRFYQAEWDYDNTFYTVKCKMEKKEIMKILKNMYY